VRGKIINQKKSDGYQEYWERNFNTINEKVVIPKKTKTKSKEFNISRLWVQCLEKTLLKIDFYRLIRKKNLKHLD